jgi:hypothetical protein
MSVFSEPLMGPSAIISSARATGFDTARDAQ